METPTIKEIPPETDKITKLRGLISGPTIITPMMYGMILDIVDGHKILAPCICDLKRRLRNPPTITVDVPLDYKDPLPLFKNFVVDPQNKNAFEASKGWAVAYVKQVDYPSPLFCGPTGTGKTRLIWTIISEVAWSLNRYNNMIFDQEMAKVKKRMEPDPRPPYRRFTYKYITLPKFAENVRIYCSSHRDVVNYRKSLNSASILVLDDIGAENMTDFVREQFHLLVEERVVKRGPLLVACNFMKNELEQWTGSRILSRLRGACDIMDVMGADKRIQEKERRARKV